MDISGVGVVENEDDLNVVATCTRMHIDPAHSHNEDTYYRPRNDQLQSILSSHPDSFPISNSTSSGAAALARSFFLFMGIMFRRPSKLFRPSRVDTWGALRQLAISADQSLSPTFVRTLLKTRRGILALVASVTPPLLINTTLGFLLFTSHSFFALTLARLPLFRRDDKVISMKEELNLETIISGPSIIPRHPTLLSAIAGAGAGAIQGVAFTPIENLVRLLKDSASSLRLIFARALGFHPAAPPTAPSPLTAIKTFLSSDTWRKNPSWWTGWRWSVVRDACFFAAFDVSRRTSLRVRSMLEEGNHGELKTSSRVAQASTLVVGGVGASLLAQVASRPFRACQRAAQQSSGTHPALKLYRAQGLRPFFKNPDPVSGTLARRVGWRLAGVAPWSLSFVVWAAAGGEI